MYATITAKGQITLPAAARRALGLHEGQKVELRIEGDSLVIEAPRNIRGVRERIRAEAEKQGTWGHIPTADDAWTSRVEELRADR